MTERTYILRPLPFPTDSGAFGALAAVGTRLREGSAKRAELTAWLAAPATGEGFWDDAEAESRDAVAVVVAWLGGSSPGGGGALVARDRLESVLVALGAAALAGNEQAAAFEARLGAALASLDAGARDRDLAARVSAEDVAKLARVAQADAGVWWLDLVALAPLAKGGRLLKAMRATRASAEAVTEAMVLHVLAKRLARAPGAQAQLFAEVVGQEDDGASLAGAPLVARMFDGEVLVVALGLREEDGDTVPPGLFVQVASGAPERLVAVELSPPLERVPTRAKNAYWVPLSGATERGYELRVSFRGEGKEKPSVESIRIDVD